MAAIYAYKLLVFACIAGFAAHDLRTRRVPDRVLLLFCPVALTAPFLNALLTSQTADSFIAPGRCCFCRQNVLLRRRLCGILSRKKDCCPFGQQSG